MRTSLFLLLTLFLTVPLMAADAPAPPAVADFTAVTLLPIRAEQFRPEVAMSIWTATRAFLTVRGYTVTPFAETLWAMTEYELCTDEVAKQLDTPALDIEVRLAGLAKRLAVSRVLLVTPHLGDIKDKHTAGLQTAVVSLGFDALAKPAPLEYSLELEAFSANGRHLWGATMKGLPKSDLYFPQEARFGEQHAFGGNAQAALLPDIARTAIIDGLAEFLQRDRMLYGTTGSVDLDLTEVKAKVKGKDIQLTWKAVANPQVVGYAVYRAFGDEPFPAYPTTMVEKSTFTDKDVDAKQLKQYRFMVSALTSTGEGEPVEVAVE